MQKSVHEIFLLRPTPNSKLEKELIWFRLKKNLIKTHWMRSIRFTLKCLDHSPKMYFCLIQKESSIISRLNLFIFILSFITSCVSHCSLSRRVFSLILFIWMTLSWCVHTYGATWQIHDTEKKMKINEDTKRCLLLLLLLLIVTNDEKKKKKAIQTSKWVVEKSCVMKCVVFRSSHKFKLKTSKQDPYI